MLFVGCCSTANVVGMIATSLSQLNPFLLNKKIFLLLGKWGFCWLCNFIFCTSCAHQWIYSSDKKTRQRSSQIPWFSDYDLVMFRQYPRKLLLYFEHRFHLCFMPTFPQHFTSFPLGPSINCKANMGTKSNTKCLKFTKTKY